MQKEFPMAQFVETYRGVVYPWHCDQLGHMNVQHYVGMFDQATFHIFARAGYTWPAEDAEPRLAFPDVRHEIDYRAEQPVGSLIVIESAFVRVGNKSLTMLHRMKNVETGVLAATSRITCVCFDLRTRKSAEMPPELRAGLEAHVVAEEAAKP